MLKVLLVVAALYVAGGVIYALAVRREAVRDGHPFDGVDYAVAIALWLVVLLAAIFGRGGRPER